MTQYRTCVYIDGFNLYYAAVVNKPKLNIRYPSLWDLCLNKLNSFDDQAHRLAEIHYFTARVKVTSTDPSKRKRQRHYIHALKREGVQLCYGRFSRYEDSAGNPTSKEKQTDVNLATHFVHGAYPSPDPTQGYDYAVIISNDTDFCGAIKFVLKKFPEKKVDIWTVEGTEIARELDDMTVFHLNMLHHELTDTDLKNTPQIANKDYSGKII